MQWKKLLKPEKYKDIIISSLKFLVTDKRVKLLDAKDRKYQFWKRNPLSVELRNHAVFRQKLDYIHWDPVKAGMCKLPEEYKYSSALFYKTGINNPSINSGRFPGTLWVSCNWTLPGLFW